MYLNYHSYLMMSLNDVYDLDANTTVMQHRQLIDRCFRHNSVEQIIQSLRRETHPFAKEVLARMEANSLLSMKIALQMLRRATNMPYGEALKMELNVALNKALDSETELGVRTILMKPKTIHPINPGFRKNVSDQEVLGFFEENKFAKQIDLGIVENALLPTRHFFEKFSDSVRVFINETSSPQEEVREAVELEIKDALRAEGINMLDKTVTIPLARE